MSWWRRRREYRHRARDPFVVWLPIRLLRGEQPVLLGRLPESWWPA